MRSYEFTAKTAEKAINEGLEQLGKKLGDEDVDIQIISEGGFLRKAKVVISIVEEPVKTNFAKPEPKPEVKAEPKVEPKVEEKPQVEEVKAEEVKPEEKPQEEKLEVKTEEKKHEEKPRHNDAPKSQEEIEEAHRLFNEKHFENNSTSLEFVKGLLEKMNIQAEVTLEEKRDASEIKITAEEAGKVIGRKGEALSSIQYLANIIESAYNPSAKRVVVDAGDYKVKREETLRALAIRIAGKVEATGRPYKLDPMNAFERRIVHTELHNYPSIETHSEGVEPFRRIIVTKKK